MTATPRPKTRAPDDRQLDLRGAAERTGYGAEVLRQMMFRDPEPPPFFKVRGRFWRVWQSDLDEWAKARREILLAPHGPLTLDDEAS